MSEEIQKSPSLQGTAVLLVDDSEENRFLLANFMKKVDCAFDSAENGKIGLEMFKRGNYDLVLMDMQMPVMDGYMATAEIRKWEKSKEKKEIPIIAFTAHASKEEVDKCNQAGCNGYISKPIKKKPLLEAVEKFLSSGLDQA